MTTRVPVCRPEPGATQIQAGRNVSATSTMRPLAELAHFLAGNGTQIVPTTCPRITIASGQTRDFRFWVKAPPACTRLEWCVSMRGTSATSTEASTVAVTVPTGGSSRTVQVLPSRNYVAPITFYEELSAKPSGEQEIGIRIAPTVAGVVVEGISCRAVPRAFLDEDTTDYGQELDRLGVTQPIWTGTVGQVATRANELRTIATRAGHYHFCYPDTTSDAVQITTASPSWQSVIPLPVGLLARKQYRGDETAFVSYRVLYATSVAGAGTFRISSSSGGTDTVTLTTSTSFTWTTTRTLEIDCEDLTTDDGLQAATWDDVTLEANQTAGTVYIAVVSVIEVAV